MRALLQVVFFGGLAIAAHIALLLGLLERSGLPTLPEAGGSQAVMLRAGFEVEAMVARWDGAPDLADALRPGAVTPKTSDRGKAPIRETAAPAAGVVPVAAVAAPEEASPIPLAPLPPRLQPAGVMLTPLLRTPVIPPTERVRLRIAPAPASVPVPNLAAHGGTDALPATPAVLVPLRGTRPPPPRPNLLTGPAEPESTGTSAAGETSAASRSSAKDPVPPGPLSPDTLLDNWIRAITERVEVEASAAPDLQVSTSVVVRLLVAADGQVIEAGLVGSSGNEELDRAALDAVFRAGPVPPAPPGLDVALTSLDIPVVFKR